MRGLARNPHPLRHASALSVILVLAPGALFAGALLALRDADPRLGWLGDVARYPWQFWGVALTGAVATAAGLADWVFHKLYVTVGPREHRGHVHALGAGGVLFVVMGVASLAARPERLLVPVVVTLVATTALICEEELRFHARCGAFETRLHRLLVFGNGVAFLCWFYWLFVAGRPHG
jgi:hypothetical protein